MKKLILLPFIALIIYSGKSYAQIQRGNFLVGGNLANLNLNLGNDNYFQVNLTPKAAFFIRDNVALGGYVDFGLATAKGQGTSSSYGVGALGRYYISDPEVNLLRQGRFFLEANAGVEGVSFSGGSNTTGLGLGAGPGYAYFITPNIGLEALLKYRGIVGFGSEAYQSNLGLSFGFQIYLPGRRAQAIIEDAN